MGLLLLPLGLILARVTLSISHGHLCAAGLRSSHLGVPHFLLEFLVFNKVRLGLDGSCILDARELVFRDDNSISLAGFLGLFADIA